MKEHDYLQNSWHIYTKRLNEMFGCAINDPLFKMTEKQYSDAMKHYIAGVSIEKAFEKMEGGK